MKVNEFIRMDGSRNSLVRLIVIVAFVAVLLTLPFWGSGYAVFLLTLMGVYITLAQMWNLLAGYSGLVSLGLQMYIGVGAYTMGALAEYFNVPLIIGMLLGGALSTIIAVGLSYLLLRMRGMYFAIATWMFSQAMMLMIMLSPTLKLGDGIHVIAARALDETQKYYLSVIMLLIVIAVVVLLLRSKLGLGLFAIRDNDVGAQTSGVPLFKSKLIVMMFTGFVTGVCGGVYYTAVTTWVQPTAAFNILTWTVPAVFAVVIGGIGTVTGPIVGGVIYVFLSQFLASLSSIIRDAIPGAPDIGSLNMVILGVIAVAVILAAPKGIVGSLQNRFGFEIISARRWMRIYTDRLPDPVQQ